MEYYGIHFKGYVSIEELITLLRVEFNKNHKKSGDVHNFPEIIFIEKGEHQMFVNGREYKLSPGDLFMYAPNSYHAVNRSSAEALIISFRTNSVSISDCYNRVLHLTDGEALSFLDLWREGNVMFERVNDGKNVRFSPKKCVTEYETAIFKKKFETFLLTLIVRYGNKKKESGESSEIKEFLENNIYRSFSLEEIAKAHMMSVSRLKKIFKEQFSESPISYFHKLKIEEIKRALCDTDKSITEISELFGFESIHYFSRFFKKHIGVSPLTYRQAFNNKEFLDE